MQTADNVETCPQRGLQVLQPVIRQHASRGCHSDHDGACAASSGLIRRTARHADTDTRCRQRPLTDDVGSYLSDELGFGRLLDFGVIVPRLQQIYEWSAHELGEPGLRDCIRDGAMTYAWPFEERGVWQAKKSFVLQMAQRLLPPERAAETNRPSASAPPAC